MSVEKPNEYKLNKFQLFGIRIRIWEINQMSEEKDYVKIFNEYDSGIETLKKGEIFHYTSPEGFESILRNKKLYYTDRRFLNDKNESDYIIKFFKKNEKYFMDKMNCKASDFKWAFEKCFMAYNHGLVGVFLCSFSLEKDNLPLWNYYTKGDKIMGYNIAFDLEKFSSQTNKTGSLHAKVIYSAKKQMKIIDKAIETLFYPTVDIHNVNKEDLLAIFMKLIFISVFFKEDYYKFENEYRFIRTETMLNGNEHVSFKVRDGIFIPYVEQNFDEEAIVGLGVSPTIDREMAIKSIQVILNIYKISNRELFFSKIPIRY